MDGMELNIWDVYGLKFEEVSQPRRLEQKHGNLMRKRIERCSVYERKLVKEVLGTQLYHNYCLQGHGNGK